VPNTNAAIYAGGVQIACSKAPSFHPFIDEIKNSKKNISH
jgi:hypothetical protein